MKVFISYSHSDSAFVEYLKAHLNAQNIRVNDVYDIKLGENLVEAVYEAMESADAYIVVLSKASADSDWVTSEMSLIVSQFRGGSSKPILPILKDKKAEVPPFFRYFKYYDATETNNLDKVLTEFAKRVKEVEVLNEDKLKYEISEAHSFESNSRANLSFADDNDKSDAIASKILLEQEYRLKQAEVEYELEKGGKQASLTKVLGSSLVALIVSTTSIVFAMVSSSHKMGFDSVSIVVVASLIGAAVGGSVTMFLLRSKKK